ncbi:MAG: cytochrome b [Chromatiales bacterium]|jgi:cytochrome b561
MRNRPEGYGLVAILLHWLVALGIIGLFSLGLWMVDLTYYDAWYREAPAIHKGIGIGLFLIMLGRVLWRLSNPRPADTPDLSLLERKLAHGAHLLLYLLIFAVMASGYLISTADGRPIEVFGLFAVPALISHLPDQADIAGKIHLYLAVSLISLAGLHALAALKHHFIDRNRTLTKMLIPVRKQLP